MQIVAQIYMRRGNCVTQQPDASASAVATIEQVPPRRSSQQCPPPRHPLRLGTPVGVAWPSALPLYRPPAPLAAAECRPAVHCAGWCGGRWVTGAGLRPGADVRRVVAVAVCPCVCLLSASTSVS